jgi:transposase
MEEFDMEIEKLAAWIGIDWGDQKHDVAMQTPNGQIEQKELDQTPEAIDQWAGSLRARFGGRPVAICLEQSKGALIYALMKYEFLVLYPVNPKQLACFREALYPSGAKDDPIDAKLALKFLVTHGDSLRRWVPDDEQTRRLQILVEDRRTLVDDRTRLNNMLKSRLKQYFPLALQILGALTTDLAAEFLLQFDTFEKLKQTPPEEIASFYRTHGLYDPKKIEERLEIIAAAEPLVTDQAIIEGGRMHVHALASQLKATMEPMAQYDGQIAGHMKKHKDAPIFQSLPGAGDALAPRILVAFGTDRDRLEDASEMQRISGIAPVTKRSNRATVHRRWACNKFLLQTFHEFASHSIGKSVWAEAFYKMHRKQGKKHHAAVRVLAFKWIRIITRCWKNQTTYDDLAHTTRLIQKNSPVAQFIKEGIA